MLQAPGVSVTLGKDGKTFDAGFWGRKILEVVQQDGSLKNRNIQMYSFNYILNIFCKV
jgi:hypothetical protein